MLDTVTKIFSIVTLGVLCLMALFNIGYFYIVGFHFIGVTDISNVVYSFGLIFASALILSLLGSFIWLLFNRVVDAWTRLKRNIQWVIFAISTIVATSVIVFLLKTDAADVNATLMGIASGVMGIWACFLVHREWRSEGNVDPIVALLTTVLVSVSAIIGGIAVANQQIESDASYEVLTKSGTLSQVKILRSSSSGFIVYQNGRILFVPSGEVRLISGPTGIKRNVT